MKVPENVFITCKQQRSGEDRYKLHRMGNIFYAAVFDGHGKVNVVNKFHVVEFLTQKLHIYIEDVLNSVDINNMVKFKLNIIQLYKDLDKYMFDLKLNSGSTSCVVLVTHSHIITINLGDSRSVIYNCEGGIIHSTKDHKPNDLLEKKRIYETGGYVFSNRVNGNLAISRSFGDYDLKCYNNDSFKGNPVGCIPEITYTPLQKCNIVIGSDGLFDGIRNEDIPHVLKDCDVKETSQILVDSVCDKNGYDDVTVIVIKLN